MKRTTTRFAGYDCVKLENDALALWITQSVGPSVIGLAWQGGADLFAFTLPVAEKGFPFPRFGLL
jgi:hypothetical protein